MVKICTVSLTCCAGCLSSLVNIGELLFQILKETEVVYWPTFIDLKEIQHVDLAIVEGGIRTEEDKEITKTNLRVKVAPKEGTGIGVVEAPRGTLVHHYVLDKAGKTKNIKLIIPTQINNAAINQSVKDSAKEFIKLGEIKPELLNDVEMVIRAYDPCIKCAARSLTNQGFLTVEVRNKEGEIVKKLP